MPSYETTFAFITGDGYVEVHGSVHSRGREMVLEIDRLGDDGPYLVTGKLRNSHFEGRNEYRESAPVQAEWTRLRDRFIGFWHEEGYDWCFWFDAAAERR